MLDDLVRIALAAGQPILSLYAGQIEAQAKADGSPVTAADHAAEAIILKELQAHFPDTPIVAEEEAAAGRIPSRSARFFLVDPLDGTKEFLSGSGDFTVNIALVEDGRPEIGVVYAPARNIIFAGEDRNGARASGVSDAMAGGWRAIRCRKPASGGMAVIASRNHMSPETARFIERFAVANVVNAGSSLKFCKVAAGEADLYPRLGRTMEWDTAAGDAIVRAAGGRVCTLDGAPLLYGKRDQASDVDFANPWFVAAGDFDPFHGWGE